MIEYIELPKTYQEEQQQIMSKGILLCKKQQEIDWHHLQQYSSQHDHMIQRAPVYFKAWCGALPGPPVYLYEA